jgi:4-hydroxyacetophenone monooxygenase
VLIIGAGMLGLKAAIQLKHAGTSYTVVEKNSEVGGTWLENRYLGARVDTPSRCYAVICGSEYR